MDELCTRVNISNTLSFQVSWVDWWVSLVEYAKKSWEWMRCSRYGNLGRMHVRLNDEPLQIVDCFKYLGSQVAAGGGCERDVVVWYTEWMRGLELGERWKVCWVIEDWGGVLRSRGMGYKKCWEKEVNVLEMKCLRSLVGVSRMDRVMNKEVRIWAEIEKELASRAD